MEGIATPSTCSRQPARRQGRRMYVWRSVAITSLTASVQYLDIGAQMCVKRNQNLLIGHSSPRSQLSRHHRGKHCAGWHPEWTLAHRHGGNCAPLCRVPMFVFFCFLVISSILVPLRPDSVIFYDPTAPVTTAEFVVDTALGVAQVRVGSTLHETADPPSRGPCPLAGRHLQHSSPLLPRWSRL